MQRYDWAAVHKKATNNGIGKKRNDLLRKFGKISFCKACIWHSESFCLALRFVYPRNAHSKFSEKTTVIFEADRKTAFVSA
jgi:hypothetical protein